MPTFRCHPTSKENYKRLEHDLFIFWGRLLTDSYVTGPEERGLGVIILHQGIIIESINVMHVLGSSGHGSYLPSVYVVRDMMVLVI